tara:strand:+ start:1178 stop:1342 length:165 start_codon:yes stop_codon:yes gene_type:complete
MLSAAEKMKAEVHKHSIYWMTEFELDKWQVAGVLFDIAMDLLMVIEIDDEEDDT